MYSTRKKTIDRDCHINHLKKQDHALKARINSLVQENLDKENTIKFRKEYVAQIGLEVEKTFEAIDQMRRKRREINNAVVEHLESL